MTFEHIFSERLPNVPASLIFMNLKPNPNHNANPHPKPTWHKGAKKWWAQVHICALYIPLVM